MKVSVFAVGRMKAGPEQQLADRYFERFARIGPSLGLDFGGIAESAESQAQSATERRRDEAQKLLPQLAAGTALVLLDEHGKNPTSAELAAMIAAFRDEGRRALLLAIGGPDGHDPALREKAVRVVSFGAQTWPHQMVRIMLGEQLYRAATILSGHPYHRV